MSTASIATFAGSIGGVASAASALASIISGPAADSWWGSLRQASYGGVPFAVLGTRTAFGGRNVVHEYPFRDDAWIEPLGKLPRRFEIQGFLIENSLIYGGGSVIGQRDRMIEACESGQDQGQTLVHPTFGSIQNVSCLSSDATESVDHGRIILVRFLFMRGGKRIYPNVATAPEAAVSAAAEQTTLGALVDFAKNAATSIQAGAAVVQSAVDTAVQWYQIAETDIHDVKRFISSVSTLSGDFGRFFGGGNDGYAGSNQTAPAGTTAEQLLDADAANVTAVRVAGAELQAAAGSVSDTASFGAAAQQLVTTFAASSADPSDTIRLLTDLATFEPAGVFTGSPIGVAMQTMQTQCAVLFRRTALAAIGQAVAAYQPSSYDDATSLMVSTTTLLDAEIEVAGDAGDDTSFMALRSLRSAVVTNLQLRGSSLAPLATMTYAASLPSLTLAHRIYADASRVDQLVQQVDPIHPLFMPTSFQALAS
jgi:prophage DNA circulation protein